MSFHHAPFDKGSSSRDVEPLDDSLQEAVVNSGIHQTSASAASGQSSSKSTKAYSEEARFELLSSYIDDEVTAEERKLVAQWLMDDPNTLKMYRRLLMLRQAIRTAPIHAHLPLQVPTPPERSWGALSLATLRRTLVFLVAIALIGGMSQLATTSGQKHLQEAWQFIQSLPQGALLELPSTARKFPTDNHQP